MKAKVTLFVFMSRISPSLTTILASFPFSRLPVRSPMPKISAAFSVIACNACSFVSPYAAAVPALKGKLR